MWFENDENQSKDVVEKTMVANSVLTPEWFGSKKVINVSKDITYSDDMPELKTDLKKLKDKKTKTWYEKEKLDQVDKSEFVMELEFDVIEKGTGTVEFKGLSKIKGTSESDVKRIDNPTSLAVSSKVGINNFLNANGDKKAVRRIERDRNKVMAESNGVSLSAVDGAGVRTSPTSMAMEGANRATIKHEGLHGTFSKLSNSYGLNEEQMHSVKNHFLNMLHPHDINAIHMVMSNNGYDLDHEGVHEETMAHVHNALEGDRSDEDTALHKQNKRLGKVPNERKKPSFLLQTGSVRHHDFKELSDKRGWKDAHKNYDKTRLRDSWNNIRSAASSMSEADLHKIANSKVQPTYKAHLKID